MGFWDEIPAQAISGSSDTAPGFGQEDKSEN